MISLTDKHGLLKQFKDDQLNMSLTMFEWSNLPDSLPAVELEKMLQINGYAVIAKYQGKVYAFQGGFSGQDAYNQPTQVIINNPALKLNSTFTIDEDCVVIKNDGKNTLHESVVPNKSLEELTPDEIVEIVNRDLQSYKKITLVSVSDEPLPTTSTRKIKRFEVIKNYKDQ